MDSRTFYDDYVARQAAVGVNERHRAILAWLRRFGLKPGLSVLEIGCGIGSLTELLARELCGAGSVFAIDISPKSIETAQRRLAGAANVRFEVADALDLELRRRFDIIVLPDVIEHIPLDQHSALFGRLASWISAAGFIFLNYPNPLYLEWCRVNQPQLLQFVDQAIHADSLLGTAYPHQLYLAFLLVYSVWIEQGDYVAAVFRPVPAVPTFTRLGAGRWSVLARIRRALRSRFLPR